MLTDAPVLGRPDSFLTYILHNSVVSVWSHHAVGAALALIGQESILWPMALEHDWSCRAQICMMWMFLQ